MRHSSGERRIETYQSGSFILPLAIAAATLTTVGQLRAENWVPTTGNGFWGDSTQWQEGTVPNAIGAAAIFPSTTGTRTVTLGGTRLDLPR